MKLPLIIALAIAPVAFGQSAQARATSGNELHELCSSNGDISIEGFCVGFIVAQVEGQSFGVFISVSWLGLTDTTDEGNFYIEEILDRCIPDEVPNGQIVDVVKKYLRDNPETRHESARMLIWKALRDAFPCVE